MRFCMNDMLYAFSYALDCVAKEMVGVSTYHASRVAYLSVLMGIELGCNAEDLTDLAACAALHDCALTEYFQEEFEKGFNVIKHKEKFDMAGHCIAGENSVKGIPFSKDMTGVLLYHHENANGSGPFGKKVGEIPVFAEIIRLADEIDTSFDLSIYTKEKYEKIVKFVKRHKGILFTEKCVELFVKSITYQKIEGMKEDNVQELLREVLPLEEKDYSKEEVKRIGEVFAFITDYKSSFTSKHSMELAEKVEIMAKFYGVEEEAQIKLYFAGAVHDIGKLVIHNDILEKPDKLTAGEFTQMKNHAYYTYKMLSKIRGLEDVTRWASLHHEKLNGKGYPFGYKAEQLGLEERLMACLDIYQALTEKRVYKDGMSHEESIAIMQEMVNGEYIDGDIVMDIERVFRKGK